MTNTNPPSSISGHHDPAGEAPWAMQMVVSVTATESPTHFDVLEAAAQACVLLLDRVDQSGTAEERSLVERWREGRIRKVVRRAKRESLWSGCDQPGATTILHGSARVRAYLPGPTDAVADPLRKLQVTGLDLPRSPRATHPATSRTEPLQVWLSPHVPLTTGKAAAQVAHAAQVAYQRLRSGELTELEPGTWLRAGAPVRVEVPDLDSWPALTAGSPVHIVDAGFTEIPSGTLTCVAALGPPD